MDYETLSKNYFETETKLKKAVESLSKLVGSKRCESLISRGLKRKYEYPLPVRRRVSTKYVSTKHRDTRKLSKTPEEISEDEPASKKVALSSAVSKAKNPKSRKEVIIKQNPNLNIRLRNRRMFGIVQNTLKEFKDEQLKRQPQESKRMKILEKVEAAEEEEKKFVKNQKIDLVAKAKVKQRELRCLKKMMKIIESFEVWENNQNNLSNFILSKTKPEIFFLPGKLTSKTKELLKRSRYTNKDKIEKRRAATQRALARIKESYDISSFSDKESTLTKCKNPKKLEERRDVSFCEDPKFTVETLNLGISDDFLFY